VALLSNAMHQERFAQAFATHPRLRLVALVDEPGQEPYVAERNRTLAREHGIPYVESLDALARDDVEVVSLGAQIERRGQVAAVAARNGKHLWLDKPPAASTAVARDLAAAVEERGVTALVFSHVAAAWCVALHGAIARGEIGTLRALHLDFHFIKGEAKGLPARRLPSGTGPRDVWTFRSPGAATDPTESGHNVAAKRELAEEGWYALAVMQRLCPQPIERVYGNAGAYFLPGHHDAGVEDFATLVFALKGGPVVTLSTGRTGRRTHAGGGRMSVRAVGDAGTIVVDGGQPPVLTYSGVMPPSTQRNRPSADSTGLDGLVEHFVACMDGQARPYMTAADAVPLMAALDAAYESFETGQPVACRG
jgi:predicted dehydrogenase